MKYVVVADYVKSRSDADVHWIGVKDIKRLYRVDEEDVVGQFCSPTKFPMSMDNMLNEIRRINNEISNLTDRHGELIVLKPDYMGKYDVSRLYVHKSLSNNKEVK